MVRVRRLAAGAVAALVGALVMVAHLSTQDVLVGQNVRLGTRIGTAGSTGGVTGPHLHYEQRYNGTVVKAVLNAGGSALQRPHGIHQ
jgi:murein DD-endopeptidase MepM/ murein hydrolase activator NlpD